MVQAGTGNVSEAVFRAAIPRLENILLIRGFALYSGNTKYAVRNRAMQQTEKYWNLINRIVLIAIGAMAVAGVVLAFAPKVKQMQAYQKTRDTLQQRVEVTIASEKELRSKQRRFRSDPSYVEKVAHEVGYARKDEVIYHFPEETGAGDL